MDELLSNLMSPTMLVFLLSTVGGAVAVWYRKRLAAWKSLWTAVLDGLRAIPELRADVRGIRYYVAPNGGGSLMDSVKRTEQAVSELREQVDLMNQTAWAENDSDGHVGRFHCNASGENTYVNQPYARWLGVGKSELLGWKFLNFILPSDVDRVRRYWDACRAEHRQYRCKHSLVGADGEIIEVEVVATPIPEGGPAKRWIGTIRRLDNAAQQ